MTSISTGGFSAATAMRSPRARMDARLEAATSAGTISKTDETALSAALDDIDSALSASGGGTATTRPAPGDMKTKIDSLIDDEVKNGKLTDDQASELKDLFGANSTDQAKGPGGPGGPGGPPPPPPSDSTSDDDSTTSSTDSSTSKLDTLISFLQKLRESMTSTDTYGTTSSSSTQTALLVDKSA